MKRSIIAVAVLAAFAGSAAAQSSVTIYGRIDLGLDIEGGAAAGHAVRLSSGMAKGSQLGFRGTEDLGSGYKVGFQLETGFCADSAAGAPNFCSGSNNFMGRQARGEISGPFGSLNAGRIFSQGYLTMLRMDPFLGTAGQMNNLIDPSGFRLNNAIRYTTPTFAGVTAVVDMALGEQTGDFAGGREVGSSLNFDGESAHVSLVTYDLRNANGAKMARQNIMLTGTYDFGFMKLHALAQRSTGHPTGAALPLDAFDVMGGITVPLGGGKIQASYVHHDDKTPLAWKGDKDANQVAIGYLYPVSKRFSVYTTWGRIADEHGATDLSGNATENGIGTHAFNLGAAYDF